MGNAHITKGSTITIGTAADDIKAVVIEDFDIAVGEPGEELVSGSDGTQYTFIGEDTASSVEIKVILTDDTHDAMMTSIYGAGGTVSGGTVSSGTSWSMKNAGAAGGTVEITSPVTATGSSLKYTSYNAKGLFMKPSFVLNKGFEATLKFTLDYWIATRTVTL